MKYIKKLPENAKQIKNSEDFIDPYGNVYSYDNRNFHKNKLFIREQITQYGYKYVNVRFIVDGKAKNITKRVHRLVAETFIPNPNNLPIVMHIDNNKVNNNVSNLKWGTISENTKQAVDDGLLKSKKGIRNPLSRQCFAIDSLTNQLIKFYGSVGEASRDTGISKSTIFFQLNNLKTPIKSKIYFIDNPKNIRDHKIIIQYSMVDDHEVNRFISIEEASKNTNIANSSISGMIAKNIKPKWSKSKFYFISKNIQ